MASPSPSPTLFTFTQLIHPLPPATFFQNYWETQPYHVQRNNPLFYEKLLTLIDLHTILLRAEASNDWIGDVLYFKDKKQLHIQPHEKYAAYLQGASIVVNHGDKLWRPLNELCIGLRTEFHHVFTNLYLTPPNSQAVPKHTDDRDTLILQVEGEKNWIVYGSPVRLPFTDEMLGKGGPKWKEDLLKPEHLGKPLSITLVKGDLLYIPRGFVHEASTSSCCSLHATFAIPTSDFTWSGLIIEALQDRIRNDFSVERQEMFRRAVPNGFIYQKAISPEEKQKWTNDFQHIVSTLVDPDSFTLEKLRATFREKMEKHNLQQQLAITTAPLVKPPSLSLLVEKPENISLSYKKSSKRSKRRRGCANDWETEVSEGESGTETDERLVVTYLDSNSGASLRTEYGVELLPTLDYVQNHHQPFTLGDLPASDHFELLCYAISALQSRILVAK